MALEDIQSSIVPTTEQPKKKRKKKQQVKGVQYAGPIVNSDIFGNVTGVLGNLGSALIDLGVQASQEITSRVLGPITGTFTSVAAAGTGMPGQMATQAGQQAEKAIKEKLDYSSVNPETLRTLYVTGGVLESGYRRITEGPVASLIAFQQMAREPEKYFLNPQELMGLFDRSYARAQGDRTNIEWWENAEDPVTLGQAINATLTGNIQTTPDLMDPIAVNSYYESENGEGRYASGIIDLIAMVVFDPLNAVPGLGPVKAGAKTVTKGAKTITIAGKTYDAAKATKVMQDLILTGNEDIADVVKILQDRLSGVKRDDVVDFGTAEYSNTAESLYYEFKEWDEIANDLPDLNTIPVPGVTDARYYVNNGDVFAVGKGEFGSTILKWQLPYVKANGKKAKAGWVTAKRFPTIVLRQAQDKTLLPLLEQAEKQIVDFSKITSGVPYEHLNSIFDYTIPALKTRPGIYGSGFPLESAGRIPIVDLVARKEFGEDFLLSPNKKLQYAVVHLGATNPTTIHGTKKIVMAYNPQTKEFYFLDSFIPEYVPKAKPKKTEDLLDIQQQKLAEANAGVDDAPTVDEDFFSKLGQRYLDGELGLGKIGASQVMDYLIKYRKTGGIPKSVSLKINPAEIVDEDLATVEHFAALKTGTRAELFEEFDDLAGESAFGKSTLADEGMQDVTIVESKTKKGRRQLVWVKHPDLDLSKIAGYEVAYVDRTGAIKSSFVPAQFKMVVPPSGPGEPFRLPIFEYADEVIKSRTKKFKQFSFDTLGNLVKLDEALASFKAVEEMVARKMLEIEDLRVRIQKDQYNRTTMYDSDKNLFDIDSVDDIDLPRNPAEVGFYYDVVMKDDGSAVIQLRRRQLEWDSFDDDLRSLPETIQDAIIGQWNLTEKQLKIVNAKSAFDYDGYRTDWPLFQELNMGDEKLYTVFLDELNEWGSVKNPWRLKDYRRHINKWRKQNIAKAETMLKKDNVLSEEGKAFLNGVTWREPVGLDAKTYEYSIAELMREKAISKLIDLIKVKEYFLRNPGVKGSADGLAKANEQIGKIMVDVARDTGVVEDIFLRGNYDLLTPSRHKAMYGTQNKPEKYVSAFLRALNEVTGTNVTLRDSRILGTVEPQMAEYPVKLIDWDAIPKAKAIDGPKPTKKELETLEAWTKRINEKGSSESAIPDDVIEYLKLQAKEKLRERPKPHLFTGDEALNYFPANPIGTVPVPAGHVKLFFNAEKESGIRRISNKRFIDSNDNTKSRIAEGVVLQSQLVDQADNVYEFHIPENMLQQISPTEYLFKGDTLRLDEAGDGLVGVHKQWTQEVHRLAAASTIDDANLAEGLLNKTITPKTKGQEYFARNFTMNPEAKSWSEMFVPSGLHTQVDDFLRTESTKNSIFNINVIGKAKTMIDQVKITEQQITTDLKNVVHDVIGTGYIPIDTLNTKFKKIQSLAPKLVEVMSKPEKISFIQDVLRYTVVVNDPKDYLKTLESLTKELEKKGYTYLKANNHWADEMSFGGVNFAFADKNTPFEIQVLTRDSYDIKYQMHKFYKDLQEIRRQGKSGSSIEKEIEEKIAALASQIARPKYWSKVKLFGTWRKSIEGKGN